MIASATSRAFISREGWLNRALWSLILLGMIAAPLQAQPNLNFKSVEVNGPNVELYFRASCDKQYVNTLQQQNIEIHENGNEITEFSLTCTDGTSRLPVSVSLVFDGSASMAGIGNAAAKNGGHAFVDALLGQDEASVVWFNMGATIRQPMIASAASLHAAIESLPATGYATKWEGVFEGLSQLISHGKNAVQAVILFSNDIDDGSARSIAELVTGANANDITIFTIGFGSPSDSVDMESLATQTGGRFYQVNDSAEVGGIYTEILYALTGGTEAGCVAAYELDCPDGTPRTVQLQVNNLCNSSESRVRTYVAPLNSMLIGELPMRLTKMQARPDSVVSVLLELQRSIFGGSLQPFSFVLRYDTACLVLNSARIPPSSLIAGIPIVVTPVPGGAAISTTRRKLLAGKGTLMEFSFHALAAHDTCCTIRAENPAFTAGCYTPIIEDGEICIRPLGAISCSMDIPSIAFDTLQLRPAPMPFPVTVTVENIGSVTTNALSATIQLPPSFTLAGADAPDVFTKILQPSVLNVLQTGSVQWMVQHPGLQTEVRDTIAVWVRSANADSILCFAEVVLPPLPTNPFSTTIIPDGDLELCQGESITLDAGNGYAAYHWNTGEYAQQLTTGVPGSYFCIVRDATGNFGASDTVTVIVHPVPAVPVIVRTVDQLSTTMASSWQWYRSGQLIAGATSATLTLAETGSYSVEITNEHGCKATSASFDVTVLDVDGAPKAVHGFELYPNPTGGRFSVQLDLPFPAPSRVSVTDLLGREIRTISLDTGARIRQEIDLSAAVPGLYIVRIEAGAIIRTKMLLLR